VPKQMGIEMWDSPKERRCSLDGHQRDEGNAK